jgi:glycosyltransferase involved in cell wall biosynthesis
MRSVPHLLRYSWLSVLAIRRLAKRHQITGLIVPVDLTGLLICFGATYFLKAPLVFVCWDHPYPVEAERRGPVAIVKRALRRLLLRSAFRRCAAIICNIDPGVVVDLLPLGLTPVTFPNGTVQNESLFPRRQAVVPGLIAVTSDVTNKKGLESVIKSFAKVTRSMPEAKLLIIGRLNRAFLPNLLTLISTYGLEGSVRFTGWLPHELAMREISKASLCVFAYPPLPRYYYNFPLKVAEYLSLGKPVVGFETKGARRYISDGHNGVLVRPGDNELLGQTIIQVLRNQQLRDRLAENAVRSSKEFQWSAINRRFVAELRLVFDEYQRTNA